MKKILFYIVVVLGIAVPVNAKKAERGLYFMQKLGASYNPLGVLLDSRLYYRYPLIQKEGILWESTKIDVGIQNEWTPTDDLIAFRITVEPIAFFDITFRGGIYIMYDLLGYGFRRFDSPDAEYDYDDLDDITPEDRSGYWFTITPNIKIKVASLIIANSLNIHRFNMGDEDYFLEMRSFSLRKTQDTDLRNYVYFIYEFNDKLMAGVNYYSLYVKGTKYTAHRICGVFMFTPQIKSLYSASAALTAGAYLKDRYFKHRPYIGLRLSIELKIR